MNIGETVQKHPYMVAGGVFVVGLILVFALFGGSKGSPSTVVTQAPNNTAATTALQVAQMNAALETATIAARSQTEQTAINAALEAAKSRDSVSLANVMAQADTTRQVASIGAMIEEKRIEKDKALGTAQVSSSIQIANLNAVRDIQVAHAERDVNLAAVSGAIIMSGYENETARYISSMDYHTKIGLADRQVWDTAYRTDAAKHLATMARDTAAFTSAYETGRDTRIAELRYVTDQRLSDNATRTAMLEIDRLRHLDDMQNNGGTSPVGWLHTPIGPMDPNQFRDFKAAGLI